jgi:hypothetical protein
VDAALVGLLNDAVGGVLAVSSTATVEFFKDRRERLRAEADRKAVEAADARTAYHGLVSALQDAIERVMHLASELVLQDFDEDGSARRREELRRAELDCEKLLSRLPDKPRRDAVLEVVRVADQIRRSQNVEVVYRLLADAREPYNTALDTLAVPLRNFYRDAGLSSTAEPGPDTPADQRLVSTPMGPPANAESQA